MDASFKFSLKNKMAKKVGLIILDGWGLGAKDDSDGVYLAKTPFYDDLIKKHPNALLKTFGKDVGLPDKQMGNSVNVYNVTMVIESTLKHYNLL